MRMFVAKSEVHSPDLMFRESNGHLGRGFLLGEASGGNDGPGNSDMGGGEDDGDGGSGTLAVSKPKSQTKTPPMYRVILMNDDYTPMDFVIHVLQKFFNKNSAEAAEIMLAVHQKGAGTCGVFTYEIAETKVYQVNQYSRQNRHPLKCIMEKA